MMATDPIPEDLVSSVSENLDNVENELEELASSSDTGSEISISEKIVLESNEKRLRQRMSSLQTSIMNLKEQLKLEKELWKEDMEKIRSLQNQQESHCTCAIHAKCKEIMKTEESRSTSNFNLAGGESINFFVNKNDEKFKQQSIKQLLELQNYKRKLAETENMCSLELIRVKQSLEDLKTLQNIASEWGKKEKDMEQKMVESVSVQEIYVNKNKLNE